MSQNAASEKNSITNIFSIDLEDYFMVSAMESFTPKEEWSRKPSRLEHSTETVLSLLSRHGVKATFFTVGWVGEKFPSLVRKIHDLGHEIAAHSYHHRLLYEMTPNQFREDAKKTKSILEGITGDRVIGFRAPSFSLTRESLWAIDILREEGYEYDSSVLPAPHARGGLMGEDISRFPFLLKDFPEYPLSTLTLAGKTFPFAGGGYLRLFPPQVTEWGIKKVNKAGHPAFLYLHPWEFDPDQPREPLKGLNRFRHYVGLGTTTSKVDRLFQRFPFGSFKENLAFLAPRKNPEKQH